MAANGKEGVVCNIRCCGCCEFCEVIYVESVVRRDLGGKEH